MSAIDRAMEAAKLVGNRFKIAGVFVLSSSAALAEPPKELDCTGPFAKASDEAAIIRAFGRTNVTTAEIEGAERSTETGTVVYAKDAKRKIEILWHDAEHKRRPATIMVRSPSAFPVKPSLAIGEFLSTNMSITDVERLNGKPFQLTGFCWDMGGYVAGWASGRLDKPGAGCSVSVRFNPDPAAKGPAVKKVSGDKKISSDDPPVKAVKPFVSQISIDWPE